MINFCILFYGAQSIMKVNNFAPSKPKRSVLHDSCDTSVDESEVKAQVCDVGKLLEIL